MAASEPSDDSAEVRPVRSPRLVVWVLSAVAVAALGTAGVLVAVGADSPLRGEDVTCLQQTWSPSAPQVGDVLPDGTVESVTTVNTLGSGGVLAEVCYRG